MQRTNSNQIAQDWRKTNARFS